MIGYYPINPAGSSVQEDAFGAKFFRTHFYDRMKQVCEIDDHTPVLEIVLTSGQVLDVSHIIEIREDHMLACAFVDNRDCENTYNAYIRYVTIYRINVLTRPRAERPIGFNNRDIEFQTVPALPKMPARVGEKRTTKKK